MTDRSRALGRGRRLEIALGSAESDERLAPLWDAADRAAAAEDLEWVAATVEALVDALRARDAGVAGMDVAYATRALLARVAQRLASDQEDARARYARLASGLGERLRLAEPRILPHAERRPPVSP